jgi:hypothetical protein
LQPSGVQKVSASGFSDLGQSWKARRGRFRSTRARAALTRRRSCATPHERRPPGRSSTRHARRSPRAPHPAPRHRAWLTPRIRRLAHVGRDPWTRRLARRRHHLGLRPRHPVTQHRSIGGFLPPSRSPSQRDSPGRDGSRFEMRRPVGFRPEVQERGPLIFDCRLHPMSHPHAIVPACSTSKTTR